MGQLISSSLDLWFELDFLHLIVEFIVYVFFFNNPILPGPPKDCLLGGAFQVVVLVEMYLILDNLD